MAILKNILPFLLVSAALISSISISAAAKLPRSAKLTRKKTEIDLYWHDVVSGRSPTAVMVIPGPINATAAAAASGFGMTRMIDNPLTAGPELNSTEFGRAQGFYAAVTEEPPISLLMAMNFVFKMGKYNGSSLTIIGTNPVFDHVREMPIVGGSGLFRFATGYAQLRTHWFDANTGDAIVKYSLVVLHY